MMKKLKRKFFYKRTGGQAVLLVSCFWGGLSPALAQIDIPLSGPAYRIATSAYQASSHHDYTTAIVDAREAIRQRPDVGRLRLLLIHALTANGQVTAAQKEAEIGSKDPLLSPQVRAQLQHLASTIGKPAAVQHTDPAYLAASTAYEALSNGNDSLALAKAQQAVELKPSVEHYHELLAVALLKNGYPEGSLATIDNTINLFGADESLLEQKGLLESALGDQQEAYKDLKAALQLLPPHSDDRILRLSLADAALATSHPQDAITALAPLTGSHDYAVLIRRGQAWQNLQDYRYAEETFVAAQKAAGTDQERDTAIVAQISVLVSNKKRDEARRLFSTSYQQGFLRTRSRVDLAYLATLVGDEHAAYAEFINAYKKDDLHGAQLVDAAYIALHTYHNGAAVDLFKQAIESSSRGTYKISPQDLYNLRREVANVSRVWGVDATLSYGSSPTSSSSSVSPGESDHVLQIGSEIYWRPPGIGYRDGSTFEVFTRNFMTLADSRHGPTGASTFQNSVGTSWKPLAHYNLVLEASRLFKLSSNSRNDVLLRVATSGGFGTDLYVDRSSWWTTQYYGEVARYLQASENIADGEVRLGRSYRMDAAKSNLVLIPFVGAAASYDNYYSNQISLGIGPGVNARYWFRQTRYSAPSSYIDATLQYRFGVTGGSDDHGIFAGLTVAY